IVSKARLDLPEPLTPVTTVNWLRGISAFMFLRLWTRAPRIEITSFDILTLLSPPAAAMTAVEPCVEPINISIGRDRRSNSIESVVCSGVQLEADFGRSGRAAAEPREAAPPMLSRLRRLSALHG